MLHDVYYQTRHTECTNSGVDPGFSEGGGGGGGGGQTVAAGRVPLKHYTFVAFAQLPDFC